MKKRLILGTLALALAVAGCSDPNSPKAMHRKAREKFDKATTGYHVYDFEKAYELRDAIKYDPDFAEAYFQLGKVIYQSAKKNDADNRSTSSDECYEAIKSLETAIAMSNHCAEAQTLKSEMKGFLEKAIAKEKKEKEEKDRTENEYRTNPYSSLTNFVHTALYSNSYPSCDYNLEKMVKFTQLNEGTKYSSLGKLVCLAYGGAIIRADLKAVSDCVKLVNESEYMGPHDESTINKAVDEYVTGASHIVYDLKKLKLGSSDALFSGFTPEETLVFLEIFKIIAETHKRRFKDNPPDSGRFIRSWNDISFGASSSSTYQDLKSFYFIANMGSALSEEEGKINMNRFLAANSAAFMQLSVASLQFRGEYSHTKDRKRDIGMFGVSLYDMFCDINRNTIIIDSDKPKGLEDLKNRVEIY